MATIIDSLLVVLGLDSKPFDKAREKVDKGLEETGEQADKAGGKLDKAGKGGADSFKALAAGATKFLAIIGGTLAIKSFAEDLIQSAAAMDRLAKNLGRNVSDISAWSQAVEQAGGSAEGLQSTLDMLSREQTKLMLTGESGLLPYFSALGIAIADEAGNARTQFDMLLDMADKVDQGLLKRTDMRNLMLGMGIDQGTVNVLMQGRKATEALVAKQKDLLAITQKQASESSELRRVMVENRQQLEAFGRSVLSTVMPALTAFFRGLAAVGNWMRENSDFVAAFFTVVAAAITTYFLPALTRMAVAAWAAIAPFAPLILGVTALAAAVAALWDDFQVWKKGGDSALPWDTWADSLKTAGAAVDWLRDKVQGLIYRMIAGADALKALATGDVARFKFAIEEMLTGQQKAAAGIVVAPTPARAAPTNTPPASRKNDPIAQGYQNYLDAQKQAGVQPATGAGSLSSHAQLSEYFKSQGWTAEQTAGILANLKDESNYDPKAVGDNGKAYGIAQWHPDRQAAFLAKFGKKIQDSTLMEQAQFVQYELTQGSEKAAGDKLKATTTAKEAGETVSRYYERPAARDAEAQRRGVLASTMMAAGIPGATQAAAGAGAAQVAAAKPGAAKAGDQQTEVRIDSITVNTAATDAKGIADGIGEAVQQRFMVSNWNTGIPL